MGGRTPRQRTCLLRSPITLRGAHATVAVRRAITTQGCTSGPPVMTASGEPQTVQRVRKPTHPNGGDAATKPHEPRRHRVDGEENTVSLLRQRIRALDRRGFSKSRHLCRSKCPVGPNEVPWADRDGISRESRRLTRHHHALLADRRFPPRARHVVVAAGSSPTTSLPAQRSNRRRPGRALATSRTTGQCFT